MILYVVLVWLIDFFPKSFIIINKRNDRLIYCLSGGIFLITSLIFINITVIVKLSSLWLLIFVWTFFISLRFWLNVYLISFNNCAKLIDNLTDGLKGNIFYNVIDLFRSSLVVLLQPLSLFLRITCNLWTHHTMLSIIILSGVFFYIWVEIIYIWLQSIIYVFILLLYKSSI